MEILYATPKAEMVAWTVFEPPIRSDGKFLFEPDPANYLNLNDEDLFDGQALAEFGGRACYQSWSKSNPETAHNEGYLRNIMVQRHDSVLEHSNITFYLTGVSRSLTHEFVRHRHFSYSQLSQRYVDSSEVRFVLPPEIRDALNIDSSMLGPFLRAEFEDSCKQAMRSYVNMVELLEGQNRPRKVARQTARSVLPNATETKILVTGNFRAWKEFLIKRDSPGADAEIRELAKIIGDYLSRNVPNVFGVDARSLWDGNAQQGTAKA